MSMEIAKLLIMNLAQCEPQVQQDVLRRCNDWFQSGGDIEDDYIKKQYLYTCRHLELLVSRGKVDKHY